MVGKVDSIIGLLRSNLFVFKMLYLWKMIAQQNHTAPLRGGWLKFLGIEEVLKPGSLPKSVLCVDLMNYVMWSNSLS